MYRLETITHIWKSAVSNDRHGIVDKRLFHLARNRTRDNSIFVLIGHIRLKRHLSSLGIEFRNPLLQNHA